jgi:pimeloyl-ACP methyl ester carboxylesterase
LATPIDLLFNNVDSPAVIAAAGNRDVYILPWRCGHNGTDTSSASTVSFGNKEFWQDCQHDTMKNDIYAAINKIRDVNSGSTPANYKKVNIYGIGFGATMALVACSNPITVPGTSTTPAETGISFCENNVDKIALIGCPFYFPDYVSSIAGPLFYVTDKIIVDVVGVT